MSDDLRHVLFRKGDLDIAGHLHLPEDFNDSIQTIRVSATTPRRWLWVKFFRVRVMPLDEDERYGWLAG